MVRRAGLSNRISKISRTRRISQISKIRKISKQQNQQNQQKVRLENEKNLGLRLHKEFEPEIERVTSGRLAFPPYELHL